MRLVDVCCGAGAITLHALGGGVPPVGWMGGKRRFAGAILAALGGRVDHALMVDSSSWGWVWSTVLGPDGARVADLLEVWSNEEPRRLWDRVVAEPLPGDPIEDAARWLWAQARSASNTPVWHQDGRWWMAEKRRYRARKDAKQKQQGAGVLKGPTSTRVVADRLRLARGALVGRVEVLHADARSLEVSSDDLVVVDPPYEGCTAYEHDLPRTDVLALADRLREQGARVAVCEAEPLPLPGWHALDLSYLARRGAGREWLTLSHPPASYQPALPLRGAA